MYWKGIIATAGSTVTAALALIPAHTTVWIVLTIVSAALTAAGVYLVPNTKPPKPPVA